MKKRAGVLLVMGLFWAVQAQAKSASEVFEAVSPSVVVIKGFDAKGKQVSQGSGVAISADEVATNCHVLEDGKSFQIVYQGKEYQAKARHSDWQRDVCSLAAPGLDARPATLGATGKLKVGQKVFAVGAPQGLSLSLSDGLVSSLRPVPGGQYLQITAPISPGSSGGGLFDEDGRLIGLPTFYLTDGQQLNFAVPVEWIKELPKRQASTTQKKTAQGTTAPQTSQKTTDWLNKAIALQEKNDWPGLKNHTLRWTKAEPKDAVAWNYLGIAYKIAGQTGKAIEAYQQAIQIDTEYSTAWHNLSNAYRASGQCAKAIEAYQQVVRIKPEDASAWYFLGSVYEDCGQLLKAVESSQQAIRIDPENATAWNFLGIAYRKNGEISNAIEAHQQAIRIIPGYTSSWCNLGIAYRQSGQHAKAIEALQQAIRIDPEDAAAWYNLGIAYKIAGQTGKVMEVYKKLKTIDPDRADEFFNKMVLP